MTLGEMLSESAKRAPDKAALLFHGLSISYRQLDRMASLTAAALAAARVGREDRVAIIAGNVPEFVYALYGTWRAGAAAVPLNVMLTANELRYILADCGARVVVCEMGYVPNVVFIFCVY